jgi:hypothetical protein
MTNFAGRMQDLPSSGIFIENKIGNRSKPK